MDVFDIEWVIEVSCGKNRNNDSFIDINCGIPWESLRPLSVSAKRTWSMSSDSSCEPVDLPESIPFGYKIMLIMTYCRFCFEDLGMQCIEWFSFGCLGRLSRNQYMNSLGLLQYLWWQWRNQKRCLAPFVHYKSPWCSLKNISQLVNGFLKIFLGLFGKMILLSNSIWYEWIPLEFLSVPRCNPKAAFFEI